MKLTRLGNKRNYNSSSNDSYSAKDTKLNVAKAVKEKMSKTTTTTLTTLKPMTKLLDCLMELAAAVTLVCF